MISWALCCLIIWSDKAVPCQQMWQYMRDCILREEKFNGVCRKLFTQQLDKDSFPELALQFYNGEENPAHYLVIAEVTDIIA